MDNGYGRLIQQAMINIRYKGGRVQEQDTAISMVLCRLRKRIR